MVEIFHDCNSTAEARDLKVTAHLPDYAHFVSADWNNNFGRSASDVDSESNSVGFTFHSMQKSEIIRFNVTFEFAETHPYFTTARIYFTALPIEHSYKMFPRDTDTRDPDTVYSPKISTELIQLQVQRKTLEKICLSLFAEYEGKS